MKCPACQQMLSVGVNTRVLIAHMADHHPHLVCVDTASYVRCICGYGGWESMVRGHLERVGDLHALQEHFAKALLAGRNASDSAPLTEQQANDLMAYLQSPIESDF